MHRGPHALHGGGRLTQAILRQRIALTRENGFAFSHDTVAAGVMGVGVVVSRPGDLQQLALSVSMPATQLGDDERAALAATIREIAEPEQRKSA